MAHLVLILSQVQSAGPAGILCYRSGRKLRNITRQRRTYPFQNLTYVLPEKKRFLRPKIHRARVLPFVRRQAANRYPLDVPLGQGYSYSSTYFKPRQLPWINRPPRLRYPPGQTEIPLAAAGPTANLIYLVGRKLRLRPRRIYQYPYVSPQPTIFPKSPNIRPHINRRLRLRPFALNLYPQSTPQPPLLYRAPPRPKIHRRRHITRQALYNTIPLPGPFFPVATRVPNIQGGSGYGSRTRGWRVADLSRREMDVLLANMSPEDRLAAMNEIDDDEIAFLLGNMDSDEE